MGRKGLPWVLATLTVAACSEATPSEPEGLSLEASTYLSLALDVMEFNSIRRDEIDWPSFRTMAFEDADNARTQADTYDAIRAALVRIGDNHSFFQPPSGRAPMAARENFPAASSSARVDPRVELVEVGIGYVEVPAFSGGISAATELAAVYHRLIERVDTIGACRWVVDLRGNSGGNMWPMLAGIGPILGDGIAGFFVEPDAIVSRWRYESGAATLDGTVIVSTTPFYQVKYAHPPVAVLTDRLTASSGEAITLAFRGRPRTRSFGQPTFGVSTTNADFELRDGAAIFLTVATMADRSGMVYGGRVVPDHVLQGVKTGERASDAVLDAALGWLEATACNWR